MQFEKQLRRSLIEPPVQRKVSLRSDQVAERFLL